MSFPVFEIISNLGLQQPQRIIHVGANYGQEFPLYKAIKAKQVVYIEPIPHIFRKLKENIAEQPNHHALQYVCSNIDGEEVVFNVASNRGESSSILPLGQHATLYPNIKYIDSFKTKARTLNNIFAQEFPQVKFDLLVLDTQGSELKVLQGAHQLLKHLQYIYTEISESPLYEGGCTYEEITALLKLHGFRLKNLVLGRKGWGNALYVRDTSSIAVPNVNLCQNKPAQQSSLSRFSKPDDAQGAVNGIKTGGYGFHTDFEQDPWWQVDLEDRYTVNEIKIYNRVDACADRIKTLRVLLSNDGKTWNEVYTNNPNFIFGGVHSGEPLIVRLESTNTRYVRLQLKEKNYLHLDEVEVYGSLRQE